MTPQTALGGVQLPPDVAALAYQRELGQHLRTYLPKRPGLGMLVLLVLSTGIPFVVAVLLAINGAWPPAGFCLLLAALFAATALRFPTFNRKLAARRVYLFQHGIIHAGKRGLADYRWDAIAWVMQQITDQLPNAVALVQQGQTVGFGDLGINAEGLVSTRHGVLPWRELQEVQVVQGYVKLRRAGKWLPWSNQPAAKIPNLFVFLTLADQLQRAAHGL